MNTLTIKDLPGTKVVDRKEMKAIRGGASIYVDGRYWGDGELDLRPWPGGFPVKVIWDLGRS